MKSEQDKEIKIITWVKKCREEKQLHKQIRREPVIREQGDELTSEWSNHG